MKLEKYKPEIFALVGAIIVLWQMLLPGYIFTLDMVWGGSWITQKLFLIALFFLLFYLPYRFFPFEIDSKFKYWFAIFYAINPFVYERFLAGHWLVLLLYAMLPPLIYYLIRLSKNFKQNIPYFLFWLLAALVIFSFYFEHFNQVLKISNPEYWQIFKTSSFPIGGSLTKIIMLYGFWGESYPWANYFIWPKLSLVLPVFALIASLVILGIRAGWSKDKKLTIFLLAIFIFSFVFASGVGEGVFKNFNLWLFENIPFWQVFRDTTKLTALLAYVYAVFGALGVSFIFKKAWPAKLFILFLLPLFYTYPMLGGFARQLQPVWYPESWHQANEILKQDPECKALFLPWHLYYSLSFNNNLITANPAPKFFDCEIISSQNIEMGEIKSTTWPDWQDPDQKIKYIIFSTDLVGQNSYDYSFLESNNLEIEFSTVDIVLYRNRDTI